MAFGPELCANGATIYFGIISGTHSSGKSTLLDQLINSGELITDPVSSNYPINLQFRRLGGITVGFVPEAATTYMQLNKNDLLTTTEYTRDHQIAIEDLAAGLIDMTFTELEEYCERSGDTRALVLTDRSQADGPVYRKLRLPGDSPWVNGADHDRTIHGMSLNRVEGTLLNYEHRSSQFLKSYCDFVILPDHTEIELEDNGKRELDAPFREDIASDIRDSYEQILGKGKVYTVKGSHDERLEQAKTIILHNTSNVA